MPFHYVTSFIDPALLNLFHGSQNQLTGRAFATELARNMAEVEKTSLWKGPRTEFAWVWSSAPVVSEAQPTWGSGPSSCLTGSAWTFSPASAPGPLSQRTTRRFA